MKKSLLTSKKNNIGWLFISPFLVGFFLVYIWIFIDSIIFSFSKITMKENGYSLINVLFENYRQVMFVNPVFNRTIISSVTQMLMNIPIILIFSLFIAVLLNQKIRGRAFFRSIFFLPVILSTGIILQADIGNSISNSTWNIGGFSTSDMSSNGIASLMDIQQYLTNIRLSPQLSNYIIGAVNNIYGIVNSSGVQILIFLAGLQSISPSIYESASIEGATGWETFWKITFPMISPLIYLNLIYSIIDSFTSPQNPIIILIYGLAFQRGDYNVASAMAWIYCIITGLIVSIVSFLTFRFVFYQEKNAR